MPDPMMVRLGDVLALERDEVVLQPEETYRPAGIYSFGKGVFEREPIRGADTKYSSLFRLHTNDFVLSRLNGWEGAVDVVSSEFDGCLVSSEYPTFTVDVSRADPRFLRWIARWPRFWDQLVPRGSMVRRKRVQPGQLLEVEIPLPSIEEQLRAAAHLESVARSARSTSEQFARNGAEAVSAMLPSLVDELISSSASGRTGVDDLVQFVSDTVHPGDDPSPAEEFVGLQHIESHTGRRIGSDPLAPMKGRKFRFRPGDVIYGYLRPYLNKVWVADRHGLCSVDQYVLRPRPGVSPSLVAHSLRGRQVLTAAIELTHSLQLPRLRSGLLASLEVPTVTESDEAAVTAGLDRIRDQVVDLAATRETQIKLANSLVPAALNQVFGSR